MLLMRPTAFCNDKDAHGGGGSDWRQGQFKTYRTTRLQGRVEWIVKVLIGEHAVTRAAQRQQRQEACQREGGAQR
jgi:hypothetical protein